MRQCKKLFLLVMFLLFWSINLLSQAPDTLWTKTYGGSEDEVGHSVRQTTDGGYIVAGYTWSYGAGSADVYLIKINANGNTLWTKTYGGTGEDIGYSVQQTSDGGYIIAGSTSSFGVGNSDVYLIKTDTNGNTLWTKTYGEGPFDIGYSVQQTTDGGYIIAGWSHWLPPAQSNVYLIKTDANGDTLWTKTFYGKGTACSYSVQQTTDGGYVLAGWTYSFSKEGSDVYIIKTDVNGDTLWTKTYGGTDDDEGWSVQQTIDGGYIITGYTTSFGVGGRDVYLIKTDEIGDTLWTETYGEEFTDRGYSVLQTADFGYIVTGYTSSPDTGCPESDIYLIKTDTNGDILWTKTYGGTSSDVGYSVQQTSDGAYIITGYTYSFGAGSNDVYLIRVMPEVAIPLVWNSPLSLFVALHQEESKTESLIVGNSGNGLLEWSISENPEVDWLLADTTSGLIYPEDSINITLTFDAADLSNGVYYDTLLLSTNDSTNPTIDVPIQLRVITGDKIFVFPNPCIARRGHTILTFCNLPDEGIIKIYNVAGSLVCKFSFTQVDIVYSCDLRNESDKNIGSGVYFYHVENKSSKVLKKGKFAVVR